MILDRVVARGIDGGAKAGEASAHFSRGRNDGCTLQWYHTPQGWRPFFYGLRSCCPLAITCTYALVYIHINIIHYTLYLYIIHYIHILHTRTARICKFKFEIFGWHVCVHDVHVYDSFKKKKYIWWKEKFESWKFGT